MKKILFLSVLLFFAFAFLHAQGNPGNNGNPYPNGQGGPQTNWNSNGGNNPWANFNLPQWLKTWLNNGGQIPPLLAADVILQARAWGQQNYNLNYLQMLGKYAQSQLTIEYLPSSPPAPTSPVILTFRLSYLSGNIIVVLTDV